MSALNIPIDIQSTKLLDWVVTRRHCSIDWSNDLNIVRSKLFKVRKEVPDVVNELFPTSLLDEGLSYFQCKIVVERLIELEGEQKTMFGNYASKRINDWQSLIKLYEKNNLYLADACQRLFRMVSYEAPALKKLIHRCNLGHQESEKRESECANTAKDAREMFSSRCQELGIAGRRLRSELFSIATELTDFYAKEVENLPKLSAAVEYYTEFLHHLSPKADRPLHMINYIMTKGNTTVFEYHNGRSPTEIILPIPDKLEVDEDGVVPGENSVDAEIDWGGIDFGDEDSAEKIDWGIDSIEVDASGISVNVEGAILEQTVDIAAGDEALSVLQLPSTRASFVNDLAELEAFLRLRIAESAKDTDDLVSSVIFQNAPASLTKVTPSDLSQMMSRVSATLAAFTSERIKHLFLIQSFPSYVNRLAESLEALLAQEKRNLALEATYKQRQLELLDERRTLEPKLQQLIDDVKLLKGQIETDIGARYNRPVNIMGATLYF